MERYKRSLVFPSDMLGGREREREIGRKKEIETDKAPRPARQRTHTEMGKHGAALF